MSDARSPMASQTVAGAPEAPAFYSAPQPRGESKSRHAESEYWQRLRLAAEVTEEQIPRSVGREACGENKQADCGDRRAIYPVFHAVSHCTGAAYLMSPVETKTPEGLFPRASLTLSLQAESGGVSRPCQTVAYQRSPWRATGVRKRRNLVLSAL